MKKTSDTLVLEITASFKGEVGYGLVYFCHIKNKIKGDIAAKDSLTMTILSNDQVNIKFLESHPSSSPFEACFRKNKEKEPYQLMPISGFVDDNETSWIIEYLKNIE